MGDAFSVGEVAARDERHAQRLQIVRRDADERDLRLRAVLLRPTFDQHLPAASTARERDVVRREGRLHARQRLDLLDDVLHAPELGVLGIVLGAGQRKPHRHQRPDVESEVVAVEIFERADEQERADQRHERERHLHDDERAAQERAPRAVAARALFQALVQVAARHLQRRKQPERHRGRDGDGHGVAQRPPVHFPVDVVRHLIGRHVRRDHACADFGEQDAHRHRGERQHDALREQLPDDAAARGADGGAQRDLAAARRRPREHQVGDVRARDEQHQRDARHHQPDHPCDVRRDEALAQRHERHFPVLIGIGVLLGEPGGDRAHVCARQVDRHARLQPRHRQQIATGAWLSGRDGLEWNPDLLAVGVLESRRHHADDDRRECVDEHRLAEHARIGVVPRLPHRVADDHDAACAGPVVLGREAVAERRRDTEQRKQIPRDRRACKPLGLGAGVGQREAAALAGAKRDERLVGGSQILQIEARQAGRGRADLLIGAGDVDDPVRILVRKRLQQDAVHDAEDRGVETNAKAETQDGDGRETLGVPETTQRVPDILEEHHSPSVRRRAQSACSASRRPCALEHLIHHARQ